MRVNGVVAAEVSVIDRGLHYGDGLFETIACANGRPRLLGRHLGRLALGCRRLKLVPPDLQALESEVRELAATPSRAIVKILVTRGAARARGYGVCGDETASRITLRYPWPDGGSASAKEGVRVRLASTRLGENPALAGLKHCNRLEQVLARAEWDDPGIAEALMFSSSGAVISGTMSNVFVVHDSRLLTPRLDRCGVAGIMRALILEEAAQAAIPVVECRLEAATLEQARELFLSNALWGVRPVRALEGVALEPGNLTRQLQRRIAARLAAAAREGAASDA
ncbi:MAG: aminodeoxychorismate lyase [Gammaproteobacteria bacterium]|nr:aminodeoxychorismate lyase [Gammaproteobacteria bacterium]